MADKDEDEQPRHEPPREDDPGAEGDESSSSSTAHLTPAQREAMARMAAPLADHAKRASAAFQAAAGLQGSQAVKAVERMKATLAQVTATPIDTSFLRDYESPETRRTRQHYELLSVERQQAEVLGLLAKESRQSRLLTWVVIAIATASLIVSVVALTRDRTQAQPSRAPAVTSPASSSSPR